jgi:hypothetical protein
MGLMPNGLQPRSLLVQRGIIAKGTWLAQMPASQCPQGRIHVNPGQIVAPCVAPVGAAIPGAKSVAGTLHLFAL